MEIKNKIENSIHQLDNWIEQNGWSGFDPYDIKDQNLIRKITDWGNKNKIAEIVREGLFESFLMFPKTSRRIFNIKPAINSKGMGLLAKAYLDLYQVSNDKMHLAKSKECLTWLNVNYSKEYPGKGWGYPFNWQSKKLISSNTPNGIVTTAVADAYWSMYKFTDDKIYLETCKEICVFLTSLPIDKINDEQICFSYTPLYVNHVHNLNLFAAEFLIKVGKEVDNQEWINLGLKSANYTVANQFEDGSFDYNGPPEPPRNLKDNYHTAFVMRMLHSIWKITNDDKYYLSLEKCYNHYLSNFFEDNRIPKFTPDRKYRIDIHSCAESINCLSELSEDFPQGIETAMNVADWTIENLQDSSGYFYHGIFESRIIRIPFTSKIAYMRWGQAWMLKGLSNLTKVIKKNV